MINLPLAEYLEKNNNFLISEIKKQTIKKEYFKNLSLPPESVIDIISKTYILCSAIVFQTGNITTLQQQIQWFKSMSANRLATDNLKANTLDFFRIFSSVLKEHTKHLISSEELNNFCLQVEQIILDTFSRGNLNE